MPGPSCFAATAVALFIAACGGSDPPAIDAAVVADALDAPPDAGLDPARLVPSCFTGGATPQIDLSGPVANWTWNDPHVIEVGGEYWMYASATNNFQFPVRLYRLTSPDGVTWSLPSPTPILDIGAAGAFDAGGVETPAVVHFQGKYHLFYTAYPYLVGDPLHSALDYRIGHAISDDGIAFTRVGTQPIAQPSGTDGDPTNDWDQYIIAEPAPVVRGNRLYVYFTTVGVNQAVQSTLQVIGVTSTTDGVTWSAPALALSPDQASYPRTADWIGYSTPNAIEIAGEVHMFVDVARQPQNGDWKQLRLHHARSQDGITGWVQDTMPIRSAGDFPWAVDEVRSPAAFLDGTTLRLYAAGHELDGTAPDHFAIGMMSCNLLGS
jgi:hypothetical protein